MFENIKKIVIWGTGVYGKSLAYYLTNKNISVDFFVDSNSNVVGEKIIFDICCNSPTEISKDNFCIVAIKNKTSQEEISKKIMEIGCDFYIFDEDTYTSICSEYSDEEFIKFKWFILFGKELNLSNPVTFDEKIQWMKLYDRNPLKTRLADKIQAKEYVKEKFCEQYIIPTLGIWNSFDEIDFSKLPSKFVLKCNHDSGSVVVVDKNSNPNFEMIKERLEKSLSTNYYTRSREHQYKEIVPKILAEEYVEEMDENLFDYKIHCFNGEPEFIQVIGNRDILNHTALQAFYDSTWHKYDFTTGVYPLYENELRKPLNFDKMLLFAKEASAPFNYVRIDIYNINGMIKFGEFTFSPDSGFCPKARPYEKMVELGNLIKI